MMDNDVKPQLSWDAKFLSSPRKRGSRGASTTILTFWIPAFAGMTLKLRFPCWVRFTKRWLACCAFLLAALSGIGWIPSVNAADVIVIVNKNNPTTSMDSVQVSNLYLGRSRTFPDGSVAHVIDHPRESLLREDFFHHINGMPLNKVNTFWARLEVSGQVLPPVIKTGSAEVMKAVEDDPKAIGYVEGTAPLEPNVTQVLKLHDGNK